MNWKEEEGFPDKKRQKINLFRTSWSITEFYDRKKEKRNKKKQIICRFPLLSALNIAEYYCNKKEEEKFVECFEAGLAAEIFLLLMDKNGSPRATSQKTEGGQFYNRFLIEV